MIRKISSILPINKVMNLFDRKSIPCAWCFKKQLVHSKNKTHSCSFCGKTFHLSGNIDIEV